MKYLILGAGPAGLTFANALMRYGCNDFRIIEQNSQVGGLCRSAYIDGAPLDIGGGHFLDVKNEKVTNFLFSFLPLHEWNLFERDSRIDLNGTLIHHPIEANVWELDEDIQIEYLKSIAVSGCNLGIRMPEKFIEWISWKLGKKIAEEYMIPYNKKMFGDNLNDLGTYWLNKLPSVSFEETLKSCLQRKAYGKQPGHSHFFYPQKYGYEEVWKRMGENIGNHLLTNTKVESLDFESLIVNDQYKSDMIICTIPWNNIPHVSGMPEKYIQLLKKLKYTSVVIEYKNEDIKSNAHWIYYPDSNLPFHRILIRKNFYSDAPGYWTETNLERYENVKNTPYAYQNSYAYPLNTIEKPMIIQELLSWAKTKKIIGLGRWGEWNHYNSDVVVDKALVLAEELCR